MPYVHGHIAVRVAHCIVVIGGKAWEDVEDIQAYKHRVWLYNIVLEQWKKYHIPKKKQVPGNLIKACGVVIGEDIHTFGGGGVGCYSNESWKLTRNTDGNFKWTRILMKHKEQTPSPRKEHSGWEYDGKLWTFGGYGPSINGYLNEHGDFSNNHNNQLLHFNPESNKWTNVKCVGTVPSPRSLYATTALDNKVWLYGGNNSSIDFDDLYELDMCSLTWKLILTMTLKPERRYACCLNVTRENQLVLHGGQNDESNEPFEDTWILNLSSYLWKKCTNVYSCRSYHTGSVGINNSIIIIGGFYTEDDYNLEPYSFCIAWPPMCNLMLEPKSLQQLSIKTVHKYRGQLPWEYLPKKLINLMQYGSKDDTTDAQDSHPEAY